MDKLTIRSTQPRQAVTACDQLHVLAQRLISSSRQHATGLIVNGAEGSVEAVISQTVDKDYEGVLRANVR